MKTIFINIENITLDKIETEKIVNSVWVAKTTFYNEFNNKVDVEMKGVSEINSYEKLIEFLNNRQKPTEVKELPNGNKIYHFKKQKL